MQVALLTDALENLAMACTYILRGEMQLDFEGGETLLRVYSKERGEWLNAVVPMPMIPTQRMVYRVDDELLLARLKKAEKSKRRVELDSFYLPMPIQEEKEDCPYLPRIAVLADRQDGCCLTSRSHSRESR